MAKVSILKFLVLTFFFSFAVLQFYYWYFFSAFSFHRLRKKKKSIQQPVSIVICAKNEAENLLTNIPEIASQDFPNFEIVLVDDHSTDNSYYVMKQLQQQYSNIHIVNKSDVKERKGKKEALAAGVALSNYDLILVTDADCIPATGKWIDFMTAPFSNEKTELVLGCSPNKKQTGFWKGFFRFETYMTALHYGSFALRNLPYMGVGRNLAYRKSFFQKHFSEILTDDHFSGDDDLLVNTGATKENTEIVMNEASFTLSAAPQSFKNWWKQKQRHLSVGGKYRIFHQILITGFPVFTIVFLAVAVVLLFSPIVLFTLVFFLWQHFTLTFIHSFGLKRFRAADLVLEAPFYLLLWIILLPVLSISSQLKHIKDWN